MTEPDVSSLITVEQAINLLDTHALTPRVTPMPLEAAASLTLAADVSADRDYPPFDKSLMDGYAVRSADCGQPGASLACVGELPAGRMWTTPLAPGTCLAIMTGSPLPPGADAVIQLEDAAADPPVGPAAGRRVLFSSAASPGRSVQHRGSEARRGDVVLAAGVALGPAQLAAAAQVGALRVPVFASPVVALLSTGDELVDPSQPVDGSMIRDANTTLLAALLTRLGASPLILPRTGDDPARLRSVLAGAMASADMLLTTGGVSMGTHDFVPSVFESLGFRAKISKLRIRPGKPFLFAVHTGASREPAPHAGAAGPVSPADAVMLPDVPRATVAFGLPGNPVSAYLCTLRLVSRVIRRLRGLSPDMPVTPRPLAASLPANGPREFYLPAVVAGETARPLPWKGSADVFTLARATHVIVRPAGAPPADAGTMAETIELL